MWTYEQQTTNSITIFKNGEKMAEIVNENDSSSEDFATAEFIVAACNEKEAK